MTARRAWIPAMWSIGLVAALWVVAHARYITDLTAFLPAKPTPVQKLLVDQVRDGPASRLILIALEDDVVAARAKVSTAMAQRLRRDAQFLSVNNGEQYAADRDREFLFQHRYLLSDGVDARRFSVDGLQAAINDTVEGLASPTGLILKSLIPRDPTGEILRIIDRLSASRGPQSRDGVWVSADGARTLLVAQSAASGSDTDAQERALGAIRAAFAEAASNSPAIHLRLSGPGVFSVEARATIKRAATRLSVVSSVLVIGLLLIVYRSIQALALGLLPVATGAVVGIAAVAVGFGLVHGITLGFGITLIGESVDYSIYFFIQSAGHTAAGGARDPQRLWPTIRLGLLTSICGFASLLPSGFPGLAQLGLYSISGLVAAALVTRFVLPELLPTGFKMHDLTALGSRIGLVRQSMRSIGGTAITCIACTLAAGAILVLIRHRDTLWDRELSALSPIPPGDLRFDAQLRADLGSADVLDLVIVSGSSLEAVQRGAERAGVTLQSLTDAQVIGGFESPANYLPSRATQRARRDALPAPPVLLANLHSAVSHLDLREDLLSGFLRDVENARQGPLVTPGDLKGTSLDAGFGALILHQADHWSALLPLHAPGGMAGSSIDIARIRAAMTAAELPDAQILDVKLQTDALYGDYLHEAMRLSAGGFVLILLLLSVALRSVMRVARVLAPLILAVLVVVAGLAVCGRQLTILHLVGMLLIVAVGSNYALFFDNEPNPQRGTFALTLASLVIANMSTVIAFGLLCFSQVPVLEALGVTVAPGAFLALLFSATMTAHSPA